MDIPGLQTLSSISPVTAISTALVLFLAVLYYLLRDRGLPPGPRGVPYLGYYPFLRMDALIHEQLQGLKDKYGDVFSLQVLGQLYIHLGTIKALREAHVTKSDCFTKRYSDFNALNVLFKDGMACLNDEPWKVQRKFFVQAFRDLGLTSMKDYMTGPIYDTVSSTVECLKAGDGKLVDIFGILNLKSAAIMRRMMFNDDGITDEELKEMLDAYLKLASIFVSKTMLLQGELARWVIFPLTADYRIAVKSRKTMVAILKKIVKRHEETFNKDNIRNIIDRCIKERNDRRSRNDATYEYFTENGLISNLMQFVGDGIASVAMFISFFMFALLEHPEEQEKIFKELEEVVGPDRQPILDDKSKLPYTNAFIYEVLRTTDFFTLFASLECTKETTLNGYKIPKGSITLINFWSCHRDPNTFENPNEFKPSRYITEPGKPKPEMPIQFGMGKRSCIGEPFTMMQVFLFLTTIIKNFRLTAPGKLSRMSLMEGKMEVFAHPRKEIL